MEKFLNFSCLFLYLNGPRSKYLFVSALLPNDRIQHYMHEELMMCLKDGLQLGIIERLNG